MAISLTFRGSDEGARATAEALARSLDQLGISADKVDFKVAQQGSDSLYGSLRTLKTEAVQHQRVFGFFGQQLAQTGLMAKETGAALVGLGAGLASGMWIMAAVEGVRLLLGLLKETKEGARASAEEQVKRANEVGDAWNALAKIVGHTREVMLGASREGELEASRNKAIEERTKLVRAEAQAQRELEKAQSDAARGKADYSAIASARSKLEAASAAYHASFEAQRADEAAINEKWDARADAEREKQGDKTVADWRKFQDEIVASGVKAAVEEAKEEARIREEARKKEEADIKRWQKEMERIEGAEAQRKGERALQDYDQKRAADALEAERAQLKQGAHEWTMYGDAIGRAIGAAVTGAQTPLRALGGLLQAVLHQVIQAAITQVTTQAAVAGAEAASSQAAVPIIGPVLAISAMGAVMSAVLGLLGSIPGRMYGGSVLSGQPYMTGEAGPELFIPGQSGAIVPNHALGGHTTINNIYAMDGNDVERVLMRHQSAMLKVQRKAAENRRRG